ncbi:MAG: hypothetical protein IKZ23_02960, partial [Clostridia bacterium]|nr:hypothetical protein [Clostridia bacterium]
AAWTGIESLEILLDLGKVKSTDTYSLYSVENFWGVHTPTTFSVAYSDAADGEFTAIEGNFSKIAVGDGDYYVSSGSTGYTSELYELRITATEAVDAQFIKFTIPLNGANLWLDEVSASLGAVVYPEPVPTKIDPNSPTTQCNVHHVDKAAGTNEISVFTSLDKLIALEGGWGAYYQLRQTPNTNEYSVVGYCSNPHDNVANDAFTKDVFKEKLNFTTISKWAVPSGYALDIYMVVKGATANPSIYHMDIGDTVTFRNLTLTEGDYTNTTVMGSAASGTVSGMIDNEIVTNNLVHALANVQTVNGIITADNAPNDGFFSGSLDYNATLKACVANKVLPTIQIDNSTQATALISAMKATGCYDVNVISASAAVLAQIRAAHAIPRTGLIYNLSKNSMTSAEIHALRQTVRSAPASFIVTNTASLSKAVVSELQEVGVAVWAKLSNAADSADFALEAVSALTAGVNGVISTDATAINDLINTHFVKDTFTHTPTVVGHRGYPRKGTENTIASFIAAYEYGADIFELDVYTTVDNALVLFHDSSFGSAWGLANTTFTGTEAEGRIRDMTKAQVDQIRYKTGEKITYLDEILAYFQDKDIRIFIEFKGSEYERTVKATADAVKAYGMEDQVCIISAALAYIEQANKYLTGTTSSYVYASTSLTGYAPQNTPEWNYTNSSKENLSILSYALMMAQASPYNANLSPSANSVSNGFRIDNFMGESTTNRGLVLNPWTYGNAWANNVAFFSKLDSITTDELDWFTDMAKFVTAEDVLLFNGQTYSGKGFTYTTYGKDVINVPEEDIVYSVISGDSVKVDANGKLVAVGEGESKVIMGYKTENTSGYAYTVYSEVVTVTVDSDNVDILKPLIALAEKMTVKDFGENDLIKLRELYAKAVNLVSTNSTDAAAISETAIALSELLDKRYDNCISNLPIKDYTAPEGNYYKWDSSIGAPGTELHPDYIDDGIRLTDGNKSVLDIRTTAYSVWQYSTAFTAVDITVNLGAVKDANIFTGYFAEYTPDGINAPTTMSISYQDPADGSWKTATVSVEKALVAENGSTKLYKLVAKSDKMLNTQYVKFNIPFVNSHFVWMDEVEVTCANGNQVEGDYIYVTGFDKVMSGGASVIYTHGTVQSKDMAWTTNILIEWSDFHNGYVVKSVTDGTGAENTPAVTLTEGQILLAVHDWETGVTDGTAVIGSADNKATAKAVKVGQILKGFGVDVENTALSLAPYVRFIDPDHICEENGEGWASDETSHWHNCVCGEILDKDNHDNGEWITTKEADVDVVGRKELKCTVCGYTLESEEIPATHAPADIDKWFNNETHHWQECGCGKHLNEFKHDQGEWIQVTPVGVDQEGYDELRCLTCGYLLDTRTFEALHEPASDKWFSDSDSHWKQCGCGKHLEEADHDEGVWVTTKENGVDVVGNKELRCTVCG